jgi:DNA-binding HxlR family transcriptional regulator
MVDPVKDTVQVVCNRFHQAVELIGGRWTGAIIQALLRGPTRYGAIRATIPDISDRMLSDRLRILEAEGLMRRNVVPETPVRIEYELTEKGRALDRALAAIGEWAETWIDAPAEPNKVEELGTPAPMEKPEESRGFLGKPRIRPKVAP